MLLGLLLTSALSAVPENTGAFLLYETANSAAETRKPSDYRYTVHAPGTQLCAASDDVNVRKAAKPNAASAATLKMGTRIKVIKEASGDVRVADRVDRWYEVDADVGGKPVRGFVFGGALTPLCFRADMDGDGDEEVVTVSMTWEFKIRVRVLETSPSGSHVTQVDLRPACEGYSSVEGGQVKAMLLPSKIAGMPLLQLDSSKEQDGDFFTAWVSYANPGKDAGGSPKVALTLNGLADPPNLASYDVEFSPQKKTAQATLRAAQDEEGKTYEVTRTSYAFQDGVFVETARKQTTEKAP